MRHFSYLYTHVFTSTHENTLLTHIFEIKHKYSYKHGRIRYTQVITFGEHMLTLGIIIIIIIIIITKSRNNNKDRQKLVAR